MKLVRSAVFITSVVSFLITSCTPPVVIKNDECPDKLTTPRVSATKGDTLSYAISFSDTKDRKIFNASFLKFLKNYDFVNISADDINNFFHIKILPVSDSLLNVSEQDSFDMDQTFEEETIYPSQQITSDSSYTDTTLLAQTIPPPKTGGSIRIFLQRADIDPEFLTLLNVFPFERDDQAGTAILSITDSSARKITLKLAGRITNAKGQVVSAVDIIESWTAFVRKRPAEGYALFRNVEGIKEFIAGNEATIRGFSASDEKTVSLRMTQLDTNSLLRLRNNRLIQHSMKLGSYYLSKEENNELTLIANPSSLNNKPYLDKISFKTGGDPNPILSFSLNKYDAIVLTSINDLDYSRRTLSKNASLVQIPGDRYFLSCISQDLAFRKFIRKIVQPEELLHNFVKTEGNIIKAIETDSFEGFSSPANDNSTANSLPRKILYRKDDPVSKNIAEKILADLSHQKIPCSLIAANLIEYDRALISGSYDCAVGWVPESIQNDKSEQIRLAAIWFNDDTDEQKRLQEFKEIPLFSINKYLLTKSNIILFNGDITGLSIKSNEQQPPATAN